MTTSRRLTAATTTAVLVVALLASCASGPATSGPATSSARVAAPQTATEAPVACGVDPVVEVVDGSTGAELPSPVEGLATFPAGYVADAVGEYLDGERDDPAWVTAAIVDLDGDERGDLRVLHHGDLTPGVRRVLERAAERWDVRLEYVQARVDVDAEAIHTILDELRSRADEVADGRPLGSLGPDDLYTGIEIEVAPGALSEADYCAVAELVDSTWPGATTTFRVGEVMEVVTLVGHAPAP